MLWHLLPGSSIVGKFVLFCCKSDGCLFACSILGLQQYTDASVNCNIFSNDTDINI